MIPKYRILAQCWKVSTLRQIWIKLKSNWVKTFLSREGCSAMERESWKSHGLSFSDLYGWGLEACADLGKYCTILYFFPHSQHRATLKWNAMDGFTSVLHRSLRWTYHLFPLRNSLITSKCLRGFPTHILFLSFIFILLHSLWIP